MRLNFLYCCFAFLFFLVIAFILHQDYFFLDEPNVLWDIKKGVAWEHSFGRALSEGRPLSGWLQLTTLTLLGNFSNLYYQRIICVVFVFLFCFLVYRFLIKQQLANSIAFLIATLTLCLPGFTIMIGWAECAWIPISTAISFLAGTITLEVYRPQLEGKEDAGKKTALLFLAILIQVISLFNYQGSALSFLLPGAFVLLLNPTAPPRVQRRFFLSFISIFLIGMVAYYALYKSLVNSYHLGTIDRARLNFNLVKKIPWFLHVCFEASKLHLLLSKLFLVQHLLSATFLFLLGRDLYKKRWASVGFLLLFSILSVFPHLLLQESWAATRNFLLMSLLFTFFTLVRLSELLVVLQNKWAALLALPFVLLFIIQLKQAVVRPFNEDYAALRKKTESLPSSLTENMIVQVKIPGFEKYSKNSGFRTYRDEFNVSPLAFSWPVDPAIKLVYSELHPDIPISRIEQYLRIEIVKPDSLYTPALISWDLSK